MKKQPYERTQEEKEADMRVQAKVDQWLLENGHIKALRSPATEKPNNAMSKSQPPTTSLQRDKR